MPENRVALLIRIPSGLKAKLADLARREHRSLNQQIEFLLEHSLKEQSLEKPGSASGKKEG
jgi:hypothetical protein